MRKILRSHPELALYLRRLSGLVLAILYLLALPPLYSVLNRTTILLAVIPIILIADTFGVWGGIAASFAATGFHLFLLPRLLDLGPAPFPGPYFWSTHAIFFTTGSLIGLMAETQRRLKKMLREYQQAQSGLRDSQQMLQLIIDHLPMSVFWKDATSTYLGGNQPLLAAAKLASVQDLIGKSDFDLRWAKEAERYRADDQEVMAQGQARLKYEEPQTLSNGQIGWLRTSKVPLRNAAGQVIGVLGLSENITEQKLAAADLLAREAELAAIYEDTPLLMLLVNEDRRILRVNRAVTEFTGQPAAELVGKFTGAVLKCTNALDNEENCGNTVNCANCQLRQIMFDTFNAGQRHHQVEITMRPSETVELTFLASTALLEIPQDKRMLICLENITERKRIQDELHQSQANLQTLFDTLDDFLLITDDDGYIIQTNPAAMRRLGYTAEELRQLTILDIHSPKQPAAVAAWMLDILSGQANLCSVPLFTKSGDLIPVETRAIRGTWSGQPVLFGIARDITERQQTADRLRENEAKLRSIIENARDGIRLLDETGVIIEWNAANETIVGIPPAEALGKYYWDVIPAYLPNRDTAIAQMRGYVQDILRTGYLPPELTTVEYQALLPNGETRAILNTLFIIKTPTGYMLGGIVHDVTALKKAEQQRTQLAAEQQRVQTLQQFVQDATHDLMTPLSIINTSTYLARKITEPAKQSAHLDNIEGQARRLQQILQDMLVMSTLDLVAPEKLMRQAMPMEEWLPGLLDYFRLLAEQKGQQFTIELAPLPIRPPIHEEYLSRALSNLLDNAIRYTDTGGEIRVSLTGDNNQASITIQDTGSGIGPEHLPHIFDRFYRVESHRPQDAGSGLGLSIAQRIIELHGGQISVESAINQGSTFIVTLPASV